MRVFSDADNSGPFEGSQSVRPWVQVARFDHLRPPTRFVAGNDTKDLARERRISNAAWRSGSEALLTAIG